MLQPDFYSHPCDQVELLQTKTAWVTLAGEFAYKIKKPVRFSFLDASTRAKRHLLCRNELRLNRRLAPDVYLEVAGIVARDDGGHTLESEVKPKRKDVDDFAVVMRRLPSEQILNRAVTDGTAEPDKMVTLAEKIASFRDGASCNKSHLFGSPQALQHLMLVNLGEAAELAVDSISKDNLNFVREYTRRFIAANKQLLEERARDGHVRDGHGDLRCDSIWLAPQGPVITDCAEHGERWRYGDDASEIASLVTDLDALGSPELGEKLAKAYADAINDSELGFLLPFYKCYRAVLHGRMHALTSLQMELPVEQRILALGMAGRFYSLARQYASGHTTPSP